MTGQSNVTHPQNGQIRTIEHPGEQIPPRRTHPITVPVKAELRALILVRVTGTVEHRPGTTDLVIKRGRQSVDRECASRLSGADRWGGWQFSLRDTLLARSG